MSHEPDTKLKIVQYGHPALRQQARRIQRPTEDIKRLVRRMIELMRGSRGLGLAANQVGLPVRVAIVEWEGEPRPLVDPEIISAKGEEVGEEGCLSVARLYGDVPRPAEVLVRARDLSGRKIKLRAEGMAARALCHEIDHLNGKLFVDRVDQSTLHWFIRTTKEGEIITQPTSLEDALKVFAAAFRRRGE